MCWIYCVPGIWPVTSYRMFHLIPRPQTLIELFTVEKTETQLVICSKSQWSSWGSQDSNPGAWLPNLHPVSLIYFLSAWEKRKVVSAAGEKGKQLWLQINLDKLGKKKGARTKGMTKWSKELRGQIRLREALVFCFRFFCLFYKSSRWQWLYDQGCWHLCLWF